MSLWRERPLAVVEELAEEQNREPKGHDCFAFMDIDRLESFDHLQSTLHESFLTPLKMVRRLGRVFSSETYEVHLEKHPISPTS